MAKNVSDLYNFIENLILKKKNVLDNIFDFSTDFKVLMFHNNIAKI